MSTYQSNTLNESQLFNSCLEQSKPYSEIAILGAPFVGKTQLYCSLMNKAYEDQSGEQNEGIANIALSNGTTQFQITDVPDTMDQYISFLKKCDAFILVFALNDYRSFNRVKDMFESIMNTRQNMRRRIIVVGNKSDTPKSEKQVKKQDILEFCKEKNRIEYIRLNSKEDKAEIQKVFSKLAESIYINSSQVDNSNPFSSLQQNELTQATQERHSVIKNHREKSIEKTPESQPCLKCQCSIF